MYQDRQPIGPPDRLPVLIHRDSSLHLLHLLLLHYITIRSRPLFYILPLLLSLLRYDRYITF